MGNTTSDSLDHSFKRLRLSETERLSLIQQLDTSPKRKIALANLRTLPNVFHIGIASNTNNELSGLQLDNSESSGFPLDNIESPGLQLDNIESPSLQLDNSESSGFPLDNIESPGLQLDNIESPSLQLDNSESSPSVDPILVTSDNITSQLDDDSDISDEDILCFMKEYTKSVMCNEKDVNTSQTSINAEMRVNTTDTKIITELSDDDLMECIKNVYGKSVDK